MVCILEPPGRPPRDHWACMLVSWMEAYPMGPNEAMVAPLSVFREGENGAPII